MKSRLKGQAAIISVLFFLSIAVMAGTGFVSIGLRQNDSSETFIKSLESYNTAESGAEDALLRLQNGWNTPSSYTFVVGDATSNISVTNTVEGTYTVTSEGDSNNRIRKVQIVYELSDAEPGFYYGAQVGEGGLEMGNTSRVIGNVFSNGPVEMDGSSRITDTVIISGSNFISDGYVGGDLYVDTCDGTEVAGVLHAYSSSSCSYESLTTDDLPVAPMPMPIPDSKIQEWKDRAAAGGVDTSYTLTSGTQSLGPKKINGDLTIQNSAHLNVTGTIWVTGEIELSNQAIVSLDSSYGGNSDIIIADGKIYLQNGSLSEGSGSEGSYLMYLSTSNDTERAITIENTAMADILYASNGWVTIENSSRMRSVIGYGIYVSNSATLRYEIGLQTPSFSSGPQAGWTINSWREVP